MLNRRINNKRFAKRNARRKVSIKTLKYPKRIEREYRGFAVGAVRYMNELINELLLSQLPNVIQQNKVDSVRSDAVSIDIGRIIDSIKLRFFARFSQKRIEETFGALANEAKNLHKEQFDAGFKRVNVVAPVLTDINLITQLEDYKYLNARLIQGMSEEALNRIQTITTTGAQQGKLTKDIAKQIKHQMGVSKNRANLIARDQTGKLLGAMNETRQKEAGVNQYIWRTSNDDRVRDEHAAREGEVFSWDSPPEDGHPGQPINCRCTAEPILSI